MQKVTKKKSIDTAAEANGVGNNKKPVSTSLSGSPRERTSALAVGHAKAGLKTARIPRTNGQGTAPRAARPNPSKKLAYSLVAIKSQSGVDLTERVKELVRL